LSKYGKKERKSAVSDELLSQQRVCLSEIVICWVAACVTLTKKKGAATKKNEAAKKKNGSATKKMGLRWK